MQPPRRPSCADRPLRAGDSQPRIPWKKLRQYGIDAE